MSLHSSITSSPISVALSLSPQSFTLKKKYELSEIEQATLRALNTRLMNLANLQSYAGACETSISFKEEQKTLFKIVKRSKYYEHEKIAAANAIGILNQSGYSFSRKNFRSVRIPGAYLEGANLVGTDLQGADLTGVTLAQSVMNYALFNGACMEGLRLGQQPFIRCDNKIQALCLSHNEKKLIAGVHKNIYIFNLETGQELKTFKGHTDSVIILALFHDEKRLASGSQDKTIRIWNLETGEEIKKLKRPKNPAMNLTLFPDFPERKRLISGNNDKTIHKWKRAEPVVKSREPIKKFEEHLEPVTTLALFSDGKRLVSGSDDGAIHIWDIETEQELQALKRHTGSITTLALFSDGKKLASGSWDKTIRIWDLETGQELQTLKGHTNAVTNLPFFSDVITIALFSDGKRLLSGGDDRTIHIWDIETGQELQTLKGRTNAFRPLFSLFDLTALALFSDGKRLITGSDSGIISIRDIETDQELQTLKGHTGSITTLALFSDGKKLVSGSNDGTIRIWDVNTEKGYVELEDSVVRVSALALNPDLTILVVGANFNIYYWDVKTGKELKKLEGHTGSVNTLAIFSNGKKLASGSDDRIICFWDIETGEQLKKLEGHLHPVTDLIFSSDGKKLASVSTSWGYWIHIWDVETGKELDKLSGEELEKLSASIFTDYNLGSNSIALFPSGKRIALGDYDGTIRIWNSETRQELKKLKGDTRNKVTAIVFFPDGKRLVSGGDNGTIRIWDIETEHELKTLKGHTGSVTTLALFPDGKKLASGSRDRTIRIWDLESYQEISIIHHPLSVSSFALKNNHFFCAVDSLGGLWMWNLHMDEESIKPELLWTTNPSLSCDRTEISHVKGLSKANRQLMVQLGVK